MGSCLYRCFCFQLIVNLTDVNDNSPIFPTLPIVQVDEDRRTESVIFNFAATDADQGTNAVLTYSILSGNNNGMSIGIVQNMTYC